MLKLVTMFLMLATVSQAKTIVQLLGSGGGESPLSLIVDEFNATQGEKLGIELQLISEAEKVNYALSSGDSLEADVLVLPDAENIGPFIKKNSLAEVSLKKNLSSIIPQHLIGEKFAYSMMTKRARIIYYNKSLVAPERIKSYNDLGANDLFGRVCLRNSGKPYNTTLVTFFLSIYGAEMTRTMLESWVKNNAVIKQKDTEVLRAVSSGECSVGLANTYYLAAVKKENPATDLGFVFPNQKSSGTHINGKFIALTKKGAAKKEALRVIEWILSEKAQKLFTDATNEFPVNPRTELSPFLKNFGAFEENRTFDFSQVSDLKPQALEVIRQAGWL